MAGTQLEARGLFAGLFDFSFTTFITLKFLRLIYLIVMVLVGITALVLFGALASRGGVGVLFALIVVPLVAFFYLVLARISLEAIALFFRIAENTNLLVAALPGQPAGGAPGSFGGGAPGFDYSPPNPSGTGYGGGFGGSYGPPAPQPPSGPQPGGYPGPGGPPA